MEKRAPLAVFAVLYTFFLTAAFAAGYYTRASTAESAPLRLPGLAPAKSFPILHEVQALLETRYIGALPGDKVLDYGAVRGLLRALDDPYTVFVEPPAHQLDTHSLAGEYGGIGVEVRKTADGEFALSPYVDSPAARAGLIDGDVLLAVDGVQLTPAHTLDEATVLLRGPVDSIVTVAVRHPSGETLEARIARKNFPIPSVTYRLLGEQAGTGLIAINRFSGKTPDELRQAAETLQAAGAVRFVLDLRNNGGGILESAVEVAGFFLDGGVVMYETQRNAPEKIYSAAGASSAAGRAPLAVLVNRSTASGAEIVAGALQDRGRAPLIGQTTYGKGSVQLIFELSDGSSLHVTAYQWFTPQRRVLDQNGLEPTIAVEPASAGGDAELARALQYFQDNP